MSPPVFPADGESTAFPATLSPYIGAVIFETFLYGIYMTLFMLSVSLLLIRKERLHVILLTSTIAMFSISTADLIYTYTLLFNKVLGTGLDFHHLYPKYPLYVANNFLAGILLIHRCYIVWGNEKLIVVGPTLLLLATTVCGFVLEGPKVHVYGSWIFMIMTLVFNVIITLLTAGRLGWKAHTSRQVLGRDLLHRYYISASILIESGLLYCAYIILDLALGHNRTANMILDSGLIQIVGITPILINVQVSITRALQNVRDTTEGISLGNLRLEFSSPIRFSPQIQATSPPELPSQLSYSSCTTLELGAQVT